MIFETKRLLIRQLSPSDINPFHQMHSNKNVMIYTDSDVKTYDEDVLDLKHCMAAYQKKDNRFWIWAVQRKEDNCFLGTVALIPFDDNNDEIGYRLDEPYWNNGYGFEALKGLLTYAKSIGKTTLIAEVYANNKASDYILKKAGFILQKEYLCKKTNLIDRLYKITL